MEEAQCLSFTEQRRLAAERAFSVYDFEGTVESSDGWEYTTPGSEMTRVLYMAPDRYIETSERCAFTVRFRNNDSLEVVEAYAISSHGVIFGSP